MCKNLISLNKVALYAHCDAQKGWNYASIIQSFNIILRVKLCSNTPPKSGIDRYFFVKGNIRVGLVKVKKSVLRQLLLVLQIKVNMV